MSPGADEKTRAAAAETNPVGTADADPEAGRAPAARGAPGDSTTTTKEEEEEEGVDNETSKGQLEPSERLTGHQVFYIFFLDGMGGMALSAGVNFAIAYVMYTTQDTKKNPIRLFQLPNTLAGDAAVTMIVQCILTWFVEWFLVAHDLAHRSVQPLGFIREPASPLLRWLFVLDKQPPNQFANVLQQALRGFLLCAPAFMLLWPVGVGALTALGERSGGDYVFADRWTPQFFKFVLGGMLGLLATPLMASFWLAKAGWETKSP